MFFFVPAQWSGGYLRALEAQQLSAAQPESLLGWKIKANHTRPTHKASQRKNLQNVGSIRHCQSVACTSSKSGCSKSFVDSEFYMF